MAKLDPAGGALSYSTYFPGADNPWAIAVDRAGNAFVAGEGGSADFPLLHDLRTPGAVPSGFRRRAFLSKLNATGSDFLYSTFLGDGASGSAQSVAVDAAGNAYVAGSIAWAGLPSTTGLQPYLGGNILFRSSEGNQSWSPRRTGLAASAVLTIAVDPSNPYAIWAGTPEGVFLSTDGGETWALRGLAGFSVGVLAFDPSTPNVIYAGTGAGGRRAPSSEGHRGGLFRSTDRGLTWAPINDGIVEAGQVVNLRDVGVDGIALDPRATQTVYALLGYQGSFGTGGAVYKSTDGGRKWTAGGRGIGTTPVALVVDPADSTLYVASLSASSRTATFPGGVYASTDGGLSFTRTLLQADLRALTRVPGSPGTLIAAGNGIYRSGDRGDSWTRVSDASVTLLAADPRVPGVLYAGASAGRIWRSLDAGATWVEIPGPPGRPLLSLGIDPLTAELRAGSIAPPDAFVAKLDPRGELVFSTFFGGSGWDAGEAVAVDPSGNVYLAGSTISPDFPMVRAVRAEPEPELDGLHRAEAFLARLDPSAGRIVYSTLLGATRRNVAFEPVRGLAVDGRGNAYVVGVTDSAGFPTVRPVQSELNGATDVFLVQVFEPEESPEPAPPRAP